MKTITAKELRLNLDKIVARARAGESIRVTYRNHTAFTIVPEQPKKAPKSWGEETATLNITGEPRNLASHIDDYLYGDAK